jgi:hypothetical protein
MTIEAVRSLDGLESRRVPQVTLRRCPLSPRKVINEPNLEDYVVGRDLEFGGCIGRV